MGRPIAIALLVGACRFQPAEAPGETADAFEPDPGCAWAYEPSNFTPCTVPIHAIPVLDTGAFTFTPETGELAKDGTPIGVFATTGTAPRVWSVENLVINATATLAIRGVDATIIAVYGDATIDGAVSVSATGTTSGPGAAACAGEAGGNADSVVTRSAGAGGGGGAFGGEGARGGDGDSDIVTKAAGGRAMIAEGEPLLIPLRGGCVGGAGGEEHNLAQATVGPGGGAGGAIQISAKSAITLTAAARIEANGGGGGGSDAITNGLTTHAGAGGGGGGSGGAIFLEASNVSLAATTTLCANGGGGGGGSHDMEDGMAAGDGACTAVDAAAGGAGNGDGGDGGYAATAATIGAPGGGGDGGGGGGGGGVGRIHVRTVAGAKPIDFIATPAPMID